MYQVDAINYNEWGPTLQMLNFGSIEVSVGPTLLKKHFCIKGGQSYPCVTAVKFLDQTMSVGCRSKTLGEIGKLSIELQ